MGQGSDTVLAQIAAEELGVRLEDVRIHAGDTAITPSTQGVRGSRETFVAGNAVKLAAGQAKEQLLDKVFSFSGRGKGRTGIVGGKDLLEEEPRAAVWTHQPRPLSKPMFGLGLCFFPHGGSDVCKRLLHTDPSSELSDQATGYGSICPAWRLRHPEVAEVEVDTETGHVTVLLGSLPLTMWAGP